MKKILASAVILAAFPLVTFAQVGSFQSTFQNIIRFIDSVLIPFLFGMAFLFFVINVVRYFVIGGSNPDAQDSAKALALYGVAAFVFLVIFWGIVNMLATSLGLENCDRVMFDYFYDPQYGPGTGGGATPSPCFSATPTDAPNSGNDGGLPFNPLP